MQIRWAPFRAALHILQEVVDIARGRLGAVAVVSVIQMQKLQKKLLQRCLRLAADRLQTNINAFM